MQTKEYLIERFTLLVKRKRYVERDLKQLNDLKFNQNSSANYVKINDISIRVDEKEFYYMKNQFVRLLESQLEEITKELDSFELVENK